MSNHIIISKIQEFRLCFELLFLSAVFDSLLKDLLKYPSKMRDEVEPGPYADVTLACPNQQLLFTLDI